MATIARIKELHAQGQGILTISNLLTTEGDPHPRNLGTATPCDDFDSGGSLFAQAVGPQQCHPRPDAITRRIAELRAQNPAIRRSASA